MTEEARNNCHRRSDHEGKVRPELDVLNRESSEGESQVGHLRQPTRISTVSQGARVRWLKSSVISELRERAQKEIIL